MLASVGELGWRGFWGVLAEGVLVVGASPRLHASSLAVSTQVVTYCALLTGWAGRFAGTGADGVGCWVEKACTPRGHGEVPPDPVHCGPWSVCTATSDGTAGALGVPACRSSHPFALVKQYEHTDPQKIRKMLSSLMWYCTNSRIEYT